LATIASATSDHRQSTEQGEQSVATHVASPPDSTSSIPAHPVLERFQRVGDGMAVYRMHDGRHFDIEQALLDALRAKAFAKPVRRRVLGVASALLLAVAMVVCQLAFSTGNLVSEASAVDALGLSPAAFAAQPWRMLTCLFLHRDAAHLLFSVLGIMFFGFTVGWRGCWVTVVTIFVVGGVVGALAAMPYSVAHGRAAFIGAEGAAFALMAASVLFVPRLLDRDGWVPWNLLAGYLFFAAFVSVGRAATGNAGPPFLHVGMAVLAGVLSGLTLVEAQHRNDYRFSAIFLVVGFFFFMRLFGQTAWMLRGLTPVTSVGTWLRMLFDFVCLCVGTLYVMIQAEVVRDRTRFAQQAALDDLVELEMDRPA